VHNKYKPGRRTAVISKGEETLSLFPPGSFSMGILEPKNKVIVNLHSVLLREVFNGRDFALHVFSSYGSTFVTTTPS